MQKQLPIFDQAFATLIRDLDRTGLLDETLVMVSQRIRPHAEDQSRTPAAITGPRCSAWCWPAAASRTARSTGRRMRSPASPKTTRIGPADLATTVYHQMGIVADKELMAPGNRPIEIVDGGKVCQELLAMIGRTAPRMDRKWGVKVKGVKPTRWPAVAEWVSRKIRRRRQGTELALYLPDVVGAAHAPLPSAVQNFPAPAEVSMPARPSCIVRIGFAFAATLAALCVWSSPSEVRAASPVLSAINPPGGQRGTDVEAVFSGAVQGRRGFVVLLSGHQPEED